MSHATYAKIASQIEDVSAMIDKLPSLAEFNAVKEDREKLLAALRDVVRRFENQLFASGKFIPRHIMAAHEISLNNARSVIQAKR